MFLNDNLQQLLWDVIVDLEAKANVLEDEDGIREDVG